jgi:hypothetical protein
MKLNYPNNLNLSQKDSKKIEDNFSKLAFDLSLRDNNIYASPTGLGGNRLQFIFLSIIENFLSSESDTIDIIIDNNDPFLSRVNWGSKLLLKSSLKDIRKILDNKFNGDTNLLNQSNIEAFVSDPSTLEKYSDRLSDAKLLMESILYCRDFVNNLVNNVKIDYAVADDYLSNISKDILIFCCRTEITLYKAMKYKLDNVLDKTFVKTYPI